MLYQFISNINIQPLHNTTEKRIRDLEKSNSIVLPDLFFICKYNYFYIKLNANSHQ